MFCPRCGQQQASGDLRFCSRCGLPLGVVSEVLANGGTLPQLLELNREKKWLTRNNGLKFGLIWFLLLDFLLVPLIAIMGGEELVAIIAILGFVGALIITLYSLLFLQKEPKYSTNAAQMAEMQTGYQVAQAAGGYEQPAGELPPQKTRPANEYTAPPQSGAGSWKAPDTGDLVAPGSVTEGTTKLLNKDKK